MRDDSAFWTAPARLSERLEAETPLREVSLRQTLISGPDVLARMEVPVLGWPDMVPDDASAYALSLRRDRVMVVGGAALPEGWDDARRRAVSDVTECWRVFDLHGPDALGILARGGEVTLDVPSKSVARVLFGLEVLLSFRGAHGVRIHVPTAQAVALMQHVFHLAPANS